jgi:hypothetical protein
LRSRALALGCLVECHYFFKKNLHLPLKMYYLHIVGLSLDFAHDPGEIESAPPKNFLYQAASTGHSGTYHFFLFFLLTPFCHNIFYTKAPCRSAIQCVLL